MKIHCKIVKCRKTHICQKITISSYMQAPNTLIKKKNTLCHQWRTTSASPPSARGLDSDVQCDVPSWVGSRRFLCLLGRTTLLWHRGVDVVFVWLKQIQRRCACLVGLKCNGLCLIKGFWLGGAKRTEVKKNLLHCIEASTYRKT